MKKIAIQKYINTVTNTTPFMKWKPGWTVINQKTENSDIEALHSIAQEQISKADSREKVLELIGTYESILKSDPQNYEALWSLGRYYLLFGAGYAASENEKEKYFIKSIQACERGMHTNPDFEKLINEKKPVWKASDALKAREIEAAGYWYTAVGHLWKYCYNPVTKILNIRVPLKAKDVLARITEIDSTWAGGHPKMYWGVYYTNLPSLLGGDMAMGEKFLNDSVEDGPKWIYTRYARAVSLHLKTKDKVAFKKDLEWVLSMDPSKADSPFPWNIYFQREAMKHLENIDTYF